MVLVIRLHVIQEARVVSRVLRLRVLSAGKKKRSEKNNVSGGNKINNTYMHI